MIYHIVWYLAKKKDAIPVVPAWAVIPPERVESNNKHRTTEINLQEILAKKIKDSPKDSFIFILQKDSSTSMALAADFMEFIKEYNLESFIALETPFVTNPVHKNRGRQLKLFVLQTPK